METCTAEQKIAYNLAFSHGEYYRKAYKRMPMQFQKSEIITTAAREMISLYRAGYTYVPGKYNEDMIFSALVSGLENYFNGAPILSSYDQIGRTFPANYLS